MYHNGIMKSEIKISNAVQITILKKPNIFLAYSSQVKPERTTCEIVVTYLKQGIWSLQPGRTQRSDRTEAAPEVNAG